MRTDGRLAELRIKIKSLAAEAALIHRDENRYRAQARRAEPG
jgi:hypothetical protein